MDKHRSISTPEERRAATKLPPLPERGPTPDEQRQWWHKHPVHVWPLDLIIPTPSLVRVGDYVIDRIDHGRGSVAWYGETQYGKSTLIRFLLQQIAEVFPDVPAFEIEFIARERPSQMDLLSQILGGIDANLPLRSPIDQRRRQVITELFLRCLPMSRRWIVLLLDEAQNLDAMSLKWLKYIMGRLANLGVRVIVFSFGQPELQGLIAKLKSEHEDHLIKRFFSEVYQFEGIRKLIELKEVFHHLDWSLRFPDPLTGWSFSQFYFPLAFAAGWRLEQEAPLALNAVRQEARRKPIGMDGLRDLVQGYYTRYSDKDHPGRKGTSTEWKKVVAGAAALHT